MSNFDIQEVVAHEIEEVMTEKKAQRTLPWWFPVLGVALTLILAGAALASSWGYNSAAIEHLEKESARLEKKVDTNQGKCEKVDEKVAKSQTVQATIKTKVDSIEKNVDEIKKGQKRIIDILLRRGR